MKQLPTVGRIVHFYTANASEQSNGRGVGPYAAIIVGICGNTDAPNQMVNVNVFADHGADFCAGSVLGLNTDGAIPSAIESGRYWTWPPQVEHIEINGKDAFDQWTEGLGDNNVEEAPTGLEGRVGKSITLALDDAKALRSYIDLSPLPYDDSVSSSVKALHWAITDADA